MVRQRIEIKKIDSLPARQVTFAKRRRGLFKKAEELSTLCDVEVGLIVFSATGKLTEFSSSSMVEVLARHNMHSDENDLEHDQPPLQLQEYREKDRHLRNLKGEDLQELGMEELIRLEKQMERGLSRVQKSKDDIRLKEMSDLKKKEATLKDENEQMKQIVDQVAPSTAAQGEKPPPDKQVQPDDTFLKLGLPFPD